MKQNWTFQRGWGSKPKTLCGRGMGVFWDNTCSVLKSRVLFRLDTNSQLSKSFVSFCFCF